MRIGFDITTLTRQKTGIGYYVYNIVRSLLSIDEINEYHLFLHSITQKNFSRVLSSKRLGEHVKCRHIRFPRRILTYGWGFLRFPPADFFYSGIDVFHTGDMSYPPFIRKPKIVGTIHDATPELFPQFHTTRNRFLSSHRNAYLRRNADAIITVSETSKRDISRVCGIAEERIFVIPHGVDHARYKQTSDRGALRGCLARYNLSEKKYLLCISTLEPRKNIEGLLYAYASLLRTGRFAGKLLVVGKKGWMYKNIFALVDSLNLRPHVFFPYYVPEEDLPFLLSGAACFVYPSFYEGFGLPILEAMSCGTPVVTSNTPALLEIAGDAGIFVDPASPEDIADGVARVMANKKFQEEMLYKGLKRSALYSWETAAKKLLQVYQSIV